MAKMTTMTNKAFADRILDAIILVAGSDSRLNQSDANPRQASKFRRQRGKVWEVYRTMDLDKKENIFRRCGYKK